jgi:stage II sporulation protein D
MMKGLKVITWVLTLVIFSPLSNSVAISSVGIIPSEFVIDGSGFGHGVGLSQIGARAQALVGKSATDILTYYFPGTEISPIPDGANIRVNVGHQLTAVTIAIDKTINQGSFQIIPTDFSDSTFVSSGSDTKSPDYAPGTSARFTLNGNRIQASLIIGKTKSVLSALSNIFTIRWSGTATNPGTLTALVVNTGLTSIRLKYGQIQIRAVAVTGIGYRLEVTDTMRLHDQYLYGVSEVSSSWPMAALQSQVIASRTYALARVGKVRKECDCQIYNTKYDQSYIGYAKEAEPKYGKLWRAAVDQTATDSDHGLAIFYKNRPINVYFFSSSGGMTQRSEDVWGTSFPYLINVLDPWSTDTTLNPSYAYWQRIITQEVMATAFGLPNIVKFEVLGRTVTGSVVAVKGYSSAGKTRQLSVSEFKSKVKLPSSWFDMSQAIPTPNPTPSSS